MIVGTDALPSKDVYCHRTGFRKRCYDMVTKCKCQLWVGIDGAHPGTGEKIVGYGCADQLRTLLIMENTQQVHQLGAAVESLRNEEVDAARKFLKELNRAVDNPQLSFQLVE